MSSGLKQFFKYIYGSEPAVLWNYQCSLRILEYHTNTGHRILRLFSAFLFNHKCNRYGMFILPNTCDIGQKIMHIGPILFNSGVRLGKNCSIRTGVSIAAGGRSSNAPVPGNNIVIGIGATLLGNIRLADGIAIGANALVNKSFTEPDIAIAGVPARKIFNNGQNAWGKKRSPAEAASADT